MSQRDSYNEIGIIEELIGSFVGSMKGPLTPHRLLGCLKGNSAIPGFTHLGRLLSACVESDSDLEILRWVVFHFDLPAEISDWTETTTRNWIALRTADQPLVDRVHGDTFEQGVGHISSIYAPSQVAARLKELQQDELMFLRKWWIYWLECTTTEFRTTVHGACNHEENHPDVLCFNCDSGKLVHVFACGEDISSPDAPRTLGALLDGENEVEAAERYLRFSKLVQRRTASEFEPVERDNAIFCNFYARVPLFFDSAPNRRMTQIFVALQEGSQNIRKVVSVLERVAVALRVCVSVVNSHVAYVIERESRIQAEAKERESRIQAEIHARIQGQAHTIINNLPIVKLRKAVSNPDTSAANVRDALIQSEILEASVLIALNRGLPEKFPQSVLGILRWLSERRESEKGRAVLTIEDNCRDTELDKESAGVAFTILWNLWDNAEKISRSHYYSESEQMSPSQCHSIFRVTVRASEGGRLEIEFRNGGMRLPQDWQEFLTGKLSKSPSTRKTTRGLEIVMRQLVVAKWTVANVSISRDQETCISIMTSPQK